MTDADIESTTAVTVSVVIPAYNAGRFIEEAIASVLAQQVPVHEIVVVNDGSTDRDYRELRNIHPCIRVIEQPNRGVSVARNTGCDAATGRYIAVLDADDVWLPGKLLCQVRHLAGNPDMDAVFCRGRLWQPTSAAAGWVMPEISDPAANRHPESTHLYYPDFLCSIPVATSTMVVKKSVWKAIDGFNESMRYGEDQDFYLRLSFAHRVCLLEMDGMLWRQHPGNCSSRVEDRNHWADMIESTVETLGTVDHFGHRVDAAKLESYLARIHFHHGYDHFLGGSFKVARAEFAQALKGTELNVKTAAFLVLCSVPGLRALARWLRRPPRSPRQPVDAHEPRL